MQIQIATLRKFLSKNNTGGLLQRSIRAGSILTLGNAADNGLRFLRNIILARLLLPEDFGLMAMVLASVSVLEAFSEVGLRQSVIQNKQGATSGFLNITWWVSSLRGSILFSIAFFVAPYISEYYHQPAALNLLRVGFIGILFNGLISPRVHVLEKELKFERWVLIMQGAGCIGVLVGIVLAFLLHNVWALLIAYVTESFLRVLFSFVFCPFLPRWQFDPEHAKAVLSFSKKMFGLPILMMLFAQIDVFVIGKVLSVGLLGMYALAKNLADIPAALILKIIHPIALPSFSTMQDDKERLRNSLFWLTKVVATFGLPLLVFLGIFSRTILSLAYGSLYGAVAVPFSILCTGSFLFICASLFMLVYVAVGRPDIHRTASLVRAVVILSLIYPASAYIGLIGTAAAILISMSLMMVVLLAYAKKLLRFRIREYCRLFFPGFKLSLIVLLPGLLLMLSDFHIQAVLLGIGLFLCFVAWMIGIINVKPFNRPVSIKSAASGGDSV